MVVPAGVGGGEVDYWRWAGEKKGDSCFLFFLPARSRLIFSKQYKFTDALPSQPSSPVMDLPGKKAVPLPAGRSLCKIRF